MFPLSDLLFLQLIDAVSERDHLKDKQLCLKQTGISPAKTLKLQHVTLFHIKMPEIKQSKISQTPNWVQPDDPEKVWSGFTSTVSMSD